MDDRIIKSDYSDEMKKSFIDYAMTVIIDRAIPDVRDGLKPVQRRILYSMYTQGFAPDKPYKKCATTVGNVLGKFHPHGDASVYDAMVRMTQDWLLLLPLVDGHGNFGSIDGDSPAAMRYTESRLKDSAMEMLGDLDKNIIDFKPNFDDSQKEPIVLPSRLPNLLINGTNGIAVGMATSIPPHNVDEVIKAVISYIDNPNITIDKLMKYIKGPDFPTGGIICNPEALKDIYMTGSSSGANENKKGMRKNNSIRIRAKIEKENAEYGKTNLIVTEIPYTASGNKSRLLDKLIDMVKNGTLNELADVRDESSMEGIRIVLEVKKGVDINNLLNKLYKKTPLEDVLSVNFLALVDGRPEVLNLKQMIQNYVDFQKEINIRKYNFLLPKAEEKKEILEGLIKARDVIDVIIEIVRGSTDVKMAKDCLMTGNIDGISFKTKHAEKEAKKLRFTERQSSAILKLELQRLVGLEIKKIQDELGKTLNDIIEYKKILNSEVVLMKVIKDYLNDIKKRYSQKRKTLITDVPVAEYVEEFKEESLVLLIDRFGYIKTIDMPVYNRTSEESLKEFKQVTQTKNTDKLCLFTNKGNLYQIKVSDIPKVKLKDKGVPWDSYLKTPIPQELPLFIDTFNNVQNDTIVFTTKCGFVLAVNGKEFKATRIKINTIRLESDDEIINVCNITNKQLSHIVLVSNSGYALKFDIASIPEMSRGRKGVKGMVLASSDYVSDVFFVSKNDSNIIVKVKNKELNVSKMRTKKRNQLGIKI